jgi:hypothetical protein
MATTNAQQSLDLKILQLQLYALCAAGRDIKHRPGGGGPAGVHGRVCTSRRCSQVKACSREVPHICGEGCKPEQHAGRPGCPKMAQPFASVS